MKTCIEHIQVYVNKGADQLRGVINAFVFATSVQSLLSTKVLVSTHESCPVQPGLCRTWSWSETPKTGFLMTRLKMNSGWDIK